MDIGQTGPVTNHAKTDLKLRLISPRDEMPGGDDSQASIDILLYLDPRATKERISNIGRRQARSTRSIAKAKRTYPLRATPP
jgi:hypothetical protein